MQPEKTATVEAMVTPYRYPTGLMHHKQMTKPWQLGITRSAPVPELEWNYALGRHEWVNTKEVRTVFGEVSGGHFTHRCYNIDQEFIAFTETNGLLLDAGGSMDRIYIPAEQMTQAYKLLEMP